MKPKVTDDFWTGFWNGLPISILLWIAIIFFSGEALGYVNIRALWDTHYTDANDNPVEPAGLQR